MPPGDQFLEHLAQHLRVHRHLDVEGSGLHHREVEAVEQPAQNPLNGRIWYSDAVEVVQFALVKETTVQEENVTDEGRQSLGQVPGIGVVKAGEERRLESGGVESPWVGCAR